jgi:hypothetical protein
MVYTIHYMLYFIYYARHTTVYIIGIYMHGGYRGSRGMGKKKEKRLQWGEALEPAGASRAVKKIESCHGQE